MVNVMKGRGFRGLLFCFAVFGSALGGVAMAAETDAAEVRAIDIIRAAVEHWRDVSSRAVFEMTIHRPDWERTMRMQMWTLGQKKSLVRVEAPAKDAGNATLLLDGQMWSYAPKINRVIKIPSSMMNQSWMGSDFSNNDVARADDIIEQYVHTLVADTQQDGHTVYTIESVPLDEAPVVWGKEVLTIRDDYVILAHAFYDQDGRLVKRMQSDSIGEMGGKTVALVETMRKTEKPEEWTRITLLDAAYGIELLESAFTLSNLRNPRF